MDTVAFLKCRESFNKTLGEAIDLIGGIGKLGSPLIIKPNLCAGYDHTGCANVKVEVIEARGQADFSTEVVESLLVHDLPVGDLERNPDALHGVVRAVDVGETAGCETPLDPVLPEHLPGAEGLRSLRHGG